MTPRFASKGPRAAQPTSANYSGRPDSHSAIWRAADKAVQCQRSAKTCLGNARFGCQDPPSLSTRPPAVLCYQRAPRGRRARGRGRVDLPHPGVQRGCFLRHYSSCTFLVAPPQLTMPISRMRTCFRSTAAGNWKRSALIGCPPVSIVTR